MEAHRLPNHVFLSYAREDEASVSAVRDVLENACIPLWVDTQDLVPGTEDWETTVRFAIQASACVVVLCSPSSHNSQFVRAELALAQHYSIPLLPLWIRGGSWIESAPLSLAQTQHLDVRGKEREDLSSSICVEVKRVVKRAKPKHAIIDDCYAGWYDYKLGYHANGFESYICVLLDKGPSSRTPPERQRKEQMAVFDPEEYASIQCLLDDLFVNYLANRTAPLSYGQDWLIIGRADRRSRGHNAGRVIAPWSYLEFLWERELAAYDMHWAAAPPTEYGLVAGSVTGIKWRSDVRTDPVFANYDRPIGLAVNLDELFDAAMFGEGKQPALLSRAGYLSQVEFDEVDPADFRHKIVIDNIWGQTGRILKESGKPFSPESYDPWGEVYGSLGDE